MLKSKYIIFVKGKPMKKKIIISLFVLAIILIFVVSCGENRNPLEIETQGLSYKNGEYYFSVSNDIEKYNLKEKITFSTKANVEFSKSEDFVDILEDEEFSLIGGNNYFYLRVSHEDYGEKIYKFNIYKKQMFTVSFNVNGGTEVSSQQISEGEKISNIPTSVRVGYDLKWDFDFNTPITNDVIIDAEWTALNYQIIIDAPETEIDKTIIDVTFNEEYSLEEYAPKRAGYKFVGWTSNDVLFNSTGVFTKASDIIVKPVYQPNQYSITYVIDDEAINPNISNSFTVENVVEFLDAGCEDKEFNGWFTEDGTKIESTIGLVDDLIIYASFTDIVYNCNVNLYISEEKVETYSFTYKEEYAIVYDPTLDGYIFNGWYILDEENEEYKKVEETGEWQYKTDIDLVAKYTAIIHQISYDVPIGAENTSNPLTFNIEDEDFVLIEPTFGSHVFLGWYLDKNFNNQVTKITYELAKDGLILYSKWQYRSKVTFDVNGGDTLEDEYYEYNSSYSLPTPTREKYIFNGWYLGNVKMGTNGTWSSTADLNLTAKWTPVTYTINYVLNGGTNNDKNPNTFNVESGIIVFKAPVKLTTPFAGWYSDPNFENKVESINAEDSTGIILYAKWNDKSVVVNYNSNGGSISSDTETVILGNQYELLEPQKPGYDFAGWYNTEDIKVEMSGTWTIDVTEISLTAKWVPIKYSIKYELDGGEASLVHEYTMESDDITLPTPVKEGYGFIGWEDDNGVIFSSITINKGSAGNRAYKAKWYKIQDERGFVYDFRNGSMIIVNYKKQILDGLSEYDEIQTFIPAEYCGYAVTEIDSYAFSEFGIAFSKTTYAKANTYTVTLRLPKTITRIGAYAFENCNGLGVAVYSTSTHKMSIKEWDKTVVFEVGNIEARDCIWGFRPALGWARFSAAPIPEDYE